jgi:lipoate-protein ligase B
MSAPVVQVQKLGLIEYQSAWDLQNRLAAEIAIGERPPNLLLLEHPHTFTFGRRGNTAHLLWDETELDQRGVAIHWVDRGGDVTYHGPGQLVGYPLLPLGKPIASLDAIPPKVDYVGYIRKLEQLIITTVAEFGVKAKQIEGLTGVWVDIDQNAVSHQQTAVSSHNIAKLAAIGVKVDSRGISRHGFALNVNPDMSYWEGIIGCGLTYPETSLAQLLDPVPEMDIVIETLIQAFSQIFNHLVFKSEEIKTTSVQPKFSK